MAECSWGQLVCISEEDGLVIPIADTSLSIGRAKACDLSMPDNKFISGRHCNLFRKNNTVWLEDTSTNGTWLNGVKIGKGQKQRLFHRDEIAVVHREEGDKGAQDIVYRYEDIAMLEAEQEVLDQTQEMDDPEENTEDYVFEDDNDEKGEEVSRKRKKIDSSEAMDEPAAKRLEGEEEENIDTKEKPKDEGSIEKVVSDVKDVPAEDQIQGTPQAASDKEDAMDKAQTSGKGEGDADDVGKEKSAAGGNGKDVGEKKIGKAEEEEQDDILETLICSICQDVLHKCVSLQPCMHSFCAGCISGWMQHSKRCPQCRKYFKRVGHNYIVNSLVDAYLKQNPDKQRTKEDLDEMDSRSNVPFNQTFNYDPSYEDDEGDYDPSDDDEEEEEEEYESENVHPILPPACRQCSHFVQPLNKHAVMTLQSTLDPSTSSAGTSGNAASTSTGDGASSSSSSSSPSKRTRVAVGGIQVAMPTPPTFQCNPDNTQHVNCSCCLEIMPYRMPAPDANPQKCCVCQRPFCHLYWGCRQFNCLGCLNKFKDMKFSEIILDTIINNNRYESTIFKDFMLSKGFHNVQLVLGEVLNGLKANRFSTPETQRHNISGDTPICYTCALRVFQQMAYLYRASLPNKDLPILVTARSNCHWGKSCRTQYNKPHHAANFNHICDQTRY